jgi:hypothetical protein
MIFLPRTSSSNIRLFSQLVKPILLHQGYKSKKAVPIQAGRGKESDSEEPEGRGYALSDDGGVANGSLLTRNAKSFLSRMSNAFVRSGGEAKGAVSEESGRNDSTAGSGDGAWDAAQTVRLFC